MRPSPARADAPDPAVWLPISDLGDVIDLEVELWADELGLTSSDAAALNASTTGNVTLVPAPAVPEAPEPQLVPEPVPELIRADEIVAPHPGAPEADPVVWPAPRRATVRTRPVAPARPKLVQAAVLTATAAAVAVGALMLMGPKHHEVTIELDGRTATRTTDAHTVGDFLREQHVSLGALDRVVPGVATSLDDGTVVRIERKGVGSRAGKSAAEAGALTSGAAPVAPAPTMPPATLPPTALPVAAPVDTSAPPPTSAPPTTSSAPRATVRRPVAAPSRSSNGSADGGASWYASPFGSDSCASRTLKFGTIVTITNVITGATTTCRVADRGPMALSRVLDLDNDVFRRLAPLGTGVIPVHISW